MEIKNLIGTNDHLVAGPFLGEFGWELMQWQGYVRWMSQFYSKTTVYGRAGSSYFYEDFASEYVVVHEKSWDTDNYELHGYDYSAWAKGIKGADILLANNECHTLRDRFLQKFIKFGTERTRKGFDVVIHARNIPKLDGNKSKSDRNWSLAYWDQLCESLEGLSIAAVGVPELSYAPPNVEDLRGIPTSELCSVLENSGVCLWPSSGLMHLASLCGTPHLVWTSAEYTWGFGGTPYRYLRGWNPFATPVLVVTDGGLTPSPEFIKEKLLDFLKSPRIEISPSNIIDNISDADFSKRKSKIRKIKRFLVG
jgi:hypothetical protein